MGWMVSGDVMKDPEVAAEAMRAYTTARAGPMGRAPFASSFVPLSLSAGERRALVERHARPGAAPAAEAQLAQLRAILAREGEPTARYSLAPLQLLADRPLPRWDNFGMGRDGMYVSVVTVLNYPFSRGPAHLRSPRAADKPVIDAGYLSNPDRRRDDGAAPRAARQHLRVGAHGGAAQARRPAPPRLGEPRRGDGHARASRRRARRRGGWSSRTGTAAERRL